MTGLGSFNDSTSKSVPYHKGRSVTQLLAKHGIETLHEYISVYTADINYVSLFAV